MSASRILPGCWCFIRWLVDLCSSTRLIIICCVPLLLAGVGCEKKETAPEFLNKGKASSGDGSVAKLGSTGTVEFHSDIEVDWLEGALPDAIVRTGSEQGNLFLPETTGGGIAAFDFDRDGWPDIVCAGGGFADVSNRVLLGAPGVLVRNQHGTGFANVSASASMDFSRSYNTGLAIADYDADGFQDILVTGYSKCQLLRNQGDGTFEWFDGPGVGLSNREWGASAAFLDADGDGLLDLYVANYANWSFDNNPICGVDARFGKGNKSTDYCGPREFQGLADVFYKNNGDGTFIDITESSGIEDRLRGLGVLAADLDADGDVDLYVANDVDPNLLYRNDGDFKFTEVARRSGVATNDAGTPEGSMGIAWGDYNLDGLQDLWVTNYQNELGALYRNNGNLLFTYASIHARIAATDEASVGWGTTFADMDCDGDEDLISVNGHIELKPLGSTVDQRPQILDNQSGKTFQLVPRNNRYLDTPQSSRGLAVADFNRDGKLDFVASRINTDAALVLNKSAHGRSLRLRLVGTKSNRNAIGARLQLKIGDRRWVRQVVGGGSYASANDSLVHIGIPKEFVDKQGELVIRWPSGMSSSFNVPIGIEEIEIVEGENSL